MTSMERSGRSGQPIDFFISYSPADERWATWLAWQLELEGYRTLIQAWDFLPGTNFIDFMDRGVRESTIVLAVLSRNYLTSRYGTMEWQAALRTDPGKLMTVRIQDCPLSGLLATITYLDLVGIPDAEQARRALLGWIQHVLNGRAKPAVEPGYPRPGTISGRYDPLANAPSIVDVTAGRRTPVAAPVYPPEGVARRDRGAGLSVLHVPGPRFGRGLADPRDPMDAAGLQARIWANVTELIDRGAPAPELLVVTGDLTESARPREIEQALAFLTGLRVLLGLEPDRVVVVPGNHDVSKAACLAYFAGCESRDRQPQPPYFPKLEHFADLFAEVYQGLDTLTFDVAQPWTLFAVPELRVVFAGLNSTMAATHRPEDDYGLIGENQAAWFAERLRQFETAGWLRIGVVRHDPLPGHTTASADPLLLRDVGSLERLVGKRLNLLLHGPGPGGVQAGLLGTLPVLPGSAPGREEIIQITATGLVRYSPYSTDVERLEQDWIAADATFPAAAVPEPEELEEPVRLELVEAPPSNDPHSRLLDRMIEVCATRYQDAKVRRVETTPPHLLLTRNQEGFNPQWRIGAHVGELTAAVVEDFLQHDPDHGSELVYQGPPPARSLVDHAARQGIRLRSFTEFQGLLDLRGYLDRQASRLRTDRRYPPDLYVPQRFRYQDVADNRTGEDLADELVNLVASDNARFVLLLADFGRGKTFALHEVSRRISATMPHLLPILIELRNLDKAHTVDGLVAAHLANYGEDRIDLRAFHYMLREGRIVLLFDGFDELVTRVSYERAADHLETLLLAAEGKAKIIVASRTQHFKSQAQVLTALGERVGLLPQRRIVSIEDFTPAQIRGYLVNRWGGDEKRADDRLRLITGIQDLLGLARNPRMLSFIADLPEERLRAAAEASRAISAAGLYREILQSWLSYEVERSADGAGGPAVLRIHELWQAVTALALRIWETGETYLRHSEITDIARTLVELTGNAQTSVPFVAHAMGAGSLLVRTDEELFGFIHSSVAEWLVANRISEQFRGGVASPPQLAARPLSQLTVDFLCDLAESGVCRAWAEEVLADAGADEIRRTNAIKIGTRLRTSPTADLRGASLRGEDLSYRDLREVDLTGADLTGARLVGTNLTGATLRDTRLVATRLDEATLAGADLRGADLTRARLAKTDLTGARIDGSRWSRASLVEVVGIPDSPALRGAAIVPGQPVNLELAPGQVGVRHGFDARRGRLPQVQAYSPDGTTLAIGSDTGGVLICDSATGLPVRTLHGHRGRVFAVDYGEEVLVTGSGDGTVRIWDAATGEQLQVIEAHREWPWPLTISPEGDRLATGDADGVLRVWELPTGRLLREFHGERGLIFSLAFRGELIATSYWDGVVKLWNIESGKSVGEFVGAEGAVFRVVITPAGDLVATGGAGGAVALWGTDGSPVRTLRGHTGRVYTVAFHPTAPILASGDTDGGVIVWDTETGDIRHTLTAHSASIYWLGFDPSGTLLVTGDSAGLVCVWDPRSDVPVHRLTAHTGSVWPFAFSPDGSQLAISDDQFTTRLWDLATGQLRHTITGHGRRVTRVRFNSTGTVLATCGNDGTVRLWDPDTARQHQQLIGGAGGLLTLETAIFNPADPDQLATVSNDGRINLLNLRTGRHQRHITVEQAPLWGIAFSPDGEIVASANDDDTVTFWYRSTGTPVHTFTEHKGRVRSIAFNADGSLAATGCDDSMVRLWDVQTGELLRTMRGHTDRVYGVVFHENLLASASWDSTARIWDVSSGEATYVLGRHTGRLWTVAVNRRDGVLATAGDDLVIRLWDIRTGEYRETLEGHSGSISSVSFSPNGDLLASGSDDGTALLWTTHPLERRATLLGLPDGWAALTPEGRYKYEGTHGGQFWHVIGMSRFELGELDQYLPEYRRLPLDEA
ncbi:TIR domain-containing protein [Pseudonocardiaceae bacterium YIM PH 21723]|nr:TIR domain-containing protein [Pseudonocardiaceae bacterium YIM PH 21723]